MQRCTGQESLLDAAERMAAALTHRGPDAAGAWADEAAGVGLGHRRLAVLDLTDAGAQPMPSACGRYVLAYNGEIYDYRRWRRELERGGASFRGSSDTEVLLEAVCRWSLPETLRRVNGMYALALWDRQRRVLTLARDRLGEKPLYYGWAGSTLLFGSELTALRAHPALRPAVSREALALLLRYSYVPAPWSVYENVWKLPAGTFLEVHGNAAAGGPGLPVAHWSLEEVVARGRAAPFRGSVEEAVDELDALLRDAVRLRLDSDVPLGAFLSGGVDSSVVSAIAQAESAAPLRTFTVGVGGSAADGDERAAGAAVARHLGTDHTEIALQPQDALELVPRLHELWSEPFADPSQLPTALLCREARRHVTVCLSGDGGDEVFAGYNRTVFGASLWQRSRMLPRPARRALAGRLLRDAPQVWDARLRRLDGVLPASLRHYAPGTKLHKLSALLAADTEEQAYLSLVSPWGSPHDVVLDSGADRPRSPAGAAEGLHAARRMMYLDAVTALPDDMLVKVDRASMAVGLEARVPLLDSRVMELGWRLPMAFHIQNGRGKALLRQVLDRYVPRALVDRPKLGFDPPVAAWLRGPLRPWAEDLLDAGRLDRQGVFAVAPVRQRWDEHLSGARNHDYALWAVLMAEQWLEHDSVPVP